MTKLVITCIFFMVLRFILRISEEQTFSKLNKTYRKYHPEYVKVKKNIDT